MTKKYPTKTEAVNILPHYDPNDKNQHFFASCLLGWATDESLPKVINKLKRNFLAAHKKNFTMPMEIIVYLVPLPTSSTYDILYKLPQVKDSLRIYRGPI